MNTKSILTLAVLAGSALAVSATDCELHTFKKITLSDKFYCEGIAAADLNKDGKMDVIAGPFWFEGPDFQKKHEFRPVKVYEPGGYSDDFMTFTCDLNGDGWKDIIQIGMPGEETFWYENPQGKQETWTRHVAFKPTDNESPMFGDVTGDGKPELIFNANGFLGYATPDWKNSTNLWTFHAISPKGDRWQRYTHGVGFGDINGDGKTDMLQNDGWWEQPASLEGDPVWKFHPVAFCDGAAQMLAYDVNGDGLNDVITTVYPHKYGLVWWEQVRDNGQISFKKHVLLGEKAEDSKYGIVFTQMHAFDQADFDGDGLMDFVTGKRWWAHPPPTDPEGNNPAVLYWFKLVRNGKEADFIPYKVDDNSGVGTQVVATDVNGDGMTDILVGNKKGIFVFINEKKTVSEEEWNKAQPPLFKK